MVEVERIKKGFEEKLLNLPTFYKSFIANSLVIMIGAGVGTWLTLKLSQHSALTLISIFVLGGIASSILINYLILKTAFRPLDNLRNTVDAVCHGDLTARAATSSIGDPFINCFRDTLNTMLTELSAKQEELKKLNQQLEERNAECRLLLEKTVRGQEEERKRIARELHDDTSQTLTSLIVGLSLAEKLTENPKLRKKFSELRELAESSQEKVRNLSLEMRSSVLDNFGLASAIQRYASDHLTRAGINVDCDLDGLSNLRLASGVEIAIYRIIQEALTNVISHSRASNVSIVASLRNSALVIVIEDDGVGFDMEEVMSQPHERRLGLVGMEERADLIGGKLSIESQPGDGTTVFLEFPMKPLEELACEQDKSGSG